jgi:hypothetical protein
MGALHEWMPDDAVLRRQSEEPQGDGIGVTHLMFFSEKFKNVGFSDWRETYKSE